MNPRLQQLANKIAEKPIEKSGDLYHPIPFPEFSDLNTSCDQESAYRKWNIIYSFLGSPTDLNNFKVLDVGANAGFYTFNFAKLGAHVSAFEPNDSYANLGKEITEISDLSVHWNMKAFELTDIQGRAYNIALLLSVFQWMSQGNDHLTQASDILSSISASSRIIFFELGCNYGKSAIQTDEKPIKWIWKLLSDHTSPKYMAYLGKVKSWKRGERYLFACTDVVLKNLTLSQRVMTYRLKHNWI